MAVSKKQREELLRVLRARFEKNMPRHKRLTWAAIQERLQGNSKALQSLEEMESSGGEPDVIGRDEKTGQYIFCDCSAETPEGRRGICYDGAGERKRNKEGLKPGGNMLEMAAAMGIEPLDEEQYRELQQLGEFDRKTQSWLKTPGEIYSLGGAVFAERRFGRVWVSHNTPPCFYRGRGFRGLLKL